MVVPAIVARPTLLLYHKDVMVVIVDGCGGGPFYSGNHHFLALL